MASCAREARASYPDLRFAHQCACLAKDFLRIRVSNQDICYITQLSGGSVAFRDMGQRVGLCEFEMLRGIA